MAKRKLTLKLDDRLIDQAKGLAAKRGVSIDGLIAEILEAIVEMDGSPASGETLAMAATHIAAKKKDRDFQARLKKNINENRAILDRMSD